jgi:hypothetical protein
MQPFGLTKDVNNNYTNTRLKLLKRMKTFGLTKDVNNNYTNTRLKLLKTNTAIWFNKTFRSVIFYGIILHLLVIVQNKKIVKERTCSKVSSDTDLHSMGRGSNPITLRAVLFSAGLKEHCLNF